MEQSRPRSYATRTTTARKPLADATSRANSATPPSHHVNVKGVPTLTGSNYAKRNNEQHLGDAVLAASPRNAASKAQTIENKRVSAIAHNTTPTSNRNSAASTISSYASGATSRRKSQIGPWQLGKTIGRGGWSTVRVVRHISTGQCGAAKIVSKWHAEERAQSLANLINSAKTDPSLLDNGKAIPFGLEREIIIMKLLEHRNIVRLYDVWENRNQLYLIMEYVAGGELYDYIDEQKGLDEITIVHLFRQIIAALLHCHRLNIHHRDLKVENILVDRANSQIKLADFGMAALQPSGKYLSTPCGSPQYAAPEVFTSRPYDGGQVDVWSCGVILYVMLTSRLPFYNSGSSRDIRKFLKHVVESNYYMPPELSPEAQDLIRRILVPQPKLRITIENIWRHPFLHKYDREFGLNQENSRMEYWIGPNPQVDDWKPLTRETVDKHILRNIRTLWHSEREGTLVDRLVSDQPNQEKYFYQALLKFEKEHLENYYGDSEAVGYSRSDRQHGKTVKNRSTGPAICVTVPRTKSQFSILNNEHLTPKDIPDVPSSSSGSIDRVLAQRNQKRESRFSNINTADCRPSSSGSRRRAASSVAAASRRPGSLRRETLRRKSKRSSTASASSLVHRDRRQGRQSDGAASINTSSPTTRSSSAFPSSSPCNTRPRTRNSYKRGVSFTHLRKSSAASGLTSSSVPRTPRQPSVPKLTAAHQEQYIAANRRSVHSSPPPIQVSKTGGKNERALPRKQVARPRHSRNSSQYIKLEARKVSTELERACEEAFNRSSVASSVQTVATERPNVYDTPPSSISHHESHPGNDGTSRKVFRSINPDVYADRPLPALPDETPRTFVVRELEETRRRLTERYKEKDLENLAGYQDLLTQLDILLKPAVTRTGNSKNHNITIVSDLNDPDLPGPLPVISEDQKLSLRPMISDPLNLTDEHDAETSVSNGNTKHRQINGEQYSAEHTIRMIDPSRPPSPVLPLNIRKASSTTTQIHPNKVASSKLGEVPPPSEDIFGMNGPFPHRLRHVSPVPMNDCFATDVNNDSADMKEPVKRRGWLWWKRKREEGQDKKERSQTSNTGQCEEVEERERPSSPHRTAKLQKRLSEFPPAQGGSTGTEFPVRVTSGEKKGILKFLAKFGEHRGGRSKPEASFEFSDNSSVESASLAALPRTFSDWSETSNNGAVETQQNWLARVLHIKPASRALCFQIGRGRVRQELVRLLREWRKYGVRDVSYDRNTNMIAARVDKANYLKIKAVHLTAELFTVLEHGRLAKLSIVRFTQTRGAASSFHKVVETIQMVLAAKGFLVEDEERRDQMCEILG